MSWDPRLGAADDLNSTRSHANQPLPKPGLPLVSDIFWLFLFRLWLCSMAKHKRKRNFSITRDEVIINSSPWGRCSVATEKRWPLLTLWMWHVISFGSPVGLRESCHKKPRGCSLDKWLWANWQLWWRTGRPEVGHAKLDNHQSTNHDSRKIWRQPP